MQITTGKASENIYTIMIYKWLISALYEELLQTNKKATNFLSQNSQR